MLDGRNLQEQSGSRAVHRAITASPRPRKKRFRENVDRSMQGCVFVTSQVSKDRVKIRRILTRWCCSSAECCPKATCQCETGAL